MAAGAEPIIWLGKFRAMVDKTFVPWSLDAKSCPVGTKFLNPVMTGKCGITSTFVNPASITATLSPFPENPLNIMFSALCSANCAAVMPKKFSDFSVLQNSGERRERAKSLRSLSFPRHTYRAESTNDNCKILSICALSLN